MSSNPFNVLLIYSCAEFPTRKTISDYLKAFRKYSHHRIFYHNDFILKNPVLLKRMKFDVVIFHHSITTPWNRERYKKRIARYKSWPCLRQAFKVGLFQDEYFNSDLANEFIGKLGLQRVCSVAPSSEWPKIYSGVDREKVDIRLVLTGYLDDDEIKRQRDVCDAAKRPIDIGYRTDYTPFLFKTGMFGLKKVEVAEKVLAAAEKIGELKLDVKVGRKFFIKGSAWYRFIRSCRYMIGVESGSSLLDWDGSYGKKLDRYISENPSATREDIQKNVVRELDGNLALMAISPRHLEAVMFKTSQILVEGFYSGLLVAGRHYLALKKDYSNLDEVLIQSKDEELRLKLVENAYADLVDSRKVLYSTYIREFFSEIPVLATQNKFQGEWVLTKANDVKEMINWILAGCYSRLRPWI